MFRSWVKWCINNNMKFLVYIVWFLILPVFIFAYFQEAAEEAAEDALYEFNCIKNAKKGDL